jgi:aspartyl-tRNA(Asn)/glutamyl-tRNA(Gln) amidotransferase subunit C
MEKQDVERLAKLARIELSEPETIEYARDITSILGYVSDINEITGGGEGEKTAGELVNVMREDGEPHESGKFTEALLSAAPERTGQYVKVKKILEDK